MNVKIQKWCPSHGLPGNHKHHRSAVYKYDNRSHQPISTLPIYWVHSPFGHFPSLNAIFSCAGIFPIPLENTQIRNGRYFRRRKVIIPKAVECGQLMLPAQSALELYPFFPAFPLLSVTRAGSVLV